MRPFEVRVPASSANLGPGFDALGLALDYWLSLDVGLGPTDEHHLAVRSFRAAGGTGDVGVRANFPGGRGLGFSGAARLAGVLGARVQQGAASSRDLLEAARLDASAMEGHADNVSASAFGGLVAVAGTHAVPVPMALDAGVVVWTPNEETSTKASRALLPESVPFTDAVFNVGRTALLVAAFAAGDVDALREATQDRLHQDRRLESVPRSRAALHALVDAGAWCAWLSGSGPSVAALCAPDDAESIGRVVTDLFPGDARVMSTSAISRKFARVRFHEER
jgi:homoserine kinase